MIGGIHPCERCKNFITQAPKHSGELGSCVAYPNGIPERVYAFMHHWDKPKECNNGIGFEPKDEDKDNG